MHPSRRRPRTPLCRRGVRNTLRAGATVRGNESSSPGSEPRLRGYVVMQDASRMPHKSHYLQSRPKAVSQWEPSALGPRRLPARHATDGPVH